MTFKEFIKWLIGVLFPKPPVPTPDPIPDPPPDPLPDPPPVPPVDPPHDERDAIDIRKVQWNNSEGEVAVWPIKATMTLCRPERHSNSVAVSYDAGTRWPNISAKDKVNSNVHIIIKRDGKFFGGTWEWLRREAVTAIWDRHLEVPFDEIGKQCQFTPLETHVMKRGDKCWMLVTTVCRGGKRSGVKERTQIVEVIWP